MKVFHNPQVNQVLRTYQKQLERTEKAEPVSMARDKIEISDQAKDFQTAMKAFKELPEVRQEKLETLKEQIAGGDYKPSAEAVAERIMEMLKSK